MFAAVHAARVAAEGHEAVCVSHQLPIWTLRRYVERKRLWHDPRRRQCGLASLTSFHFDGAKIVGIGYSEPAAHLVAMSPRRPYGQGRVTPCAAPPVCSPPLDGCRRRAARWRACTGSKESACTTNADGVIECAAGRGARPRRR